MPIQGETTNTQQQLRTFFFYLFCSVAIFGVHQACLKRSIDVEFHLYINYYYTASTWNSLLRTEQN